MKLSIWCGYSQRSGRPTANESLNLKIVLRTGPVVRVEKRESRPRSVKVHRSYRSLAQQIPNCLLQQVVPNSGEGGAMTAAHLGHASVLVIIARWSMNLDVIFYFWCPLYCHDWSWIDLTVSREKRSRGATRSQREREIRARARRKGMSRDQGYFATVFLEHLNLCCSSLSACAVVRPHGSSTTGHCISSSNAYHQ